MPEKTKVSKKPKTPTSRKSASPATTRAKKPQQSPGYYVVISHAGVSISSKQPLGDAQGRRFASYEDARAAAVDALLERIETSEQQLHELKRTTRPDERSKN